MKTLPLFITACFFTLTFILPAAAVQGADNPANVTAAASWVWPPAPDKPRVQHLKTFITPKDLGVTKGFFAKLWEFIVGEDTVDRIVSPHGIVADGDGKVYVVDWGAARI